MKDKDHADHIDPVGSNEGLHCSGARHRRALEKGGLSWYKCVRRPFKIRGPEPSNLVTTWYSISGILAGCSPSFILMIHEPKRRTPDTQISMQLHDLFSK
jgi:hypothetical protein